MGHIYRHVVRVVHHGVAYNRITTCRIVDGHRTDCHVAEHRIGPVHHAAPAAKPAAGSPPAEAPPAEPPAPAPSPPPPAPPPASPSPGLVSPPPPTPPAGQH
jgi:hypothetical protein